MIRRGEIYWIASNSRRGREVSGRRPALIIQNDKGNETSDTTVIALMSGRRFVRDYPFHVSVSAEECGLLEPSTVLLEQIQTVDLSRLGQLAGRLIDDRMYEVDRALHRSLGLFTCPIVFER